MKNVSWLGASLLTILWCHSASCTENNPKEPVAQASAKDPPVSRSSPDPTIPNDEIESVSSKVLNALTNSTSLYPSIVNPIGEAQFDSENFRPNRSRNQVRLDFRQEEQFAIHQASYQHFPKDQQLYWVLPGNRIVVETKGWQAEIEYQGREIDRSIEEKMEVTQALWGLQAAWILPQSIDELIGRENIDSANILSVAAEAKNPFGTAAPPIQINTSKYISQRSTQAIERISPPRIGTGSTASPNGGNQLFELLEAGNTPKVLQAFSTNNLQALLLGEGLFEGARLEKNILAQAGIIFGNPLTREGFEFKPE
ncbi:hypothetical protein IQ250_30610, partial [Pseudanabaenaceae cyanobacterium LEGE 13415]|nr:hypothetical protein [Pseudanabaenaceae cyanobacterium LEGE 13415]